jgi:hypothetical protein
VQVQVEGDYDPEIGFTVSLSHVEESGFYDCRVKDDEDSGHQFHVMVDENRESNDTSSSEASNANNPTIDVPLVDEFTTTLPLSTELSQLQELLDRIQNHFPGEGLTLQKTLLNRRKRHGWWMSGYLT